MKNKFKFFAVFFVIFLIYFKSFSVDNNKEGLSEYDYLKFLGETIDKIKSRFY